MLFLTAIFALCSLLEAAAAACAEDNCLRAVKGSAYPARLGTADCSSYFEVTVTPATVTVTVNTTAAYSTVYTVADSAATTTSNPLKIRQTTVSASSIPAYASACSGSVRYSSACSCIGVTLTTTTVAVPTVTVTQTSVVTGNPLLDFATVISPTPVSPTATVTANNIVYPTPGSLAANSKPNTLRQVLFGARTEDSSIFGAGTNLTAFSTQPLVNFDDVTPYLTGNPTCSGNTTITFQVTNSTTYATLLENWALNTLPGGSFTLIVAGPTYCGKPNGRTFLVISSVVGQAATLSITLTGTPTALMNAVAQQYTTYFTAPGASNGQLRKRDADTDALTVLVDLLLPDVELQPSATIYFETSPDDANLLITGVYCPECGLTGSVYIFGNFGSSYNALEVVETTYFNVGIDVTELDFLLDLDIYLPTDASESIMFPIISVAFDLFDLPDIIQFGPTISLMCGFNFTSTGYLDLINPGFSASLPEAQASWDLFNGPSQSGWDSFSFTPTQVEAQGTDFQIGLGAFYGPNIMFSFGLLGDEQESLFVAEVDMTLEVGYIDAVFDVANDVCNDGNTEGENGPEWRFSIIPGIQIIGHAKIQALGKFSFLSDYWILLYQEDVKEERRVKATYLKG